MVSRYQFILRYLLPIVDLLMLNLALGIAILGTDALGYTIALDLKKNTLVMVNLAWMCFASISGLYNQTAARQIKEMYQLTAKSITYHSLFFVPYLFFFSSIEFTLLFATMFYLAFCLLILTSRFAGTYAYQNRSKYLQAPKKVAVIGKNGTADKLVSYIKSQSGLDYYGEIDCAHEIYNDKDHDIPYTLKRQLKKATRSGVKLLYAAIDPKRLPEISSFLKEAEEQFIHVKIIPAFETSFEKQYNLSFLNDQLALVSLRKEPLEEIGNRLQKRVFDIIFSSLVILFILSWLYPIIALLIKWQSKGPVMFEQWRSGRDNTPFLCYKFRSMAVNQDADRKQATKGDPRITPIGKFLRRTSLDELPQFFNVLNGDMSVIGPRPHMIKHTEKYKQLINGYMVRHFLKPGITGWAQVNGYRGETKEPEMMTKRIEHDCWYLENWSLWLDLKIVYLTIKSLLHADETVY